MTDPQVKYNQLYTWMNARFPLSSPYTTSNNFHSQWGQDDWRDDITPVQYHHIYGQMAEDKTIEKVIVRRRSGLHTSIAQARYDVQVTSMKGDGTVPYPSAQRINDVDDLNSPNAYLYLFRSPSKSEDKLYEHTGLTQNNAVWSTVKSILGISSQSNANSTKPNSERNVQQMTNPNRRIQVIGGSSPARYEGVDYYLHVAGLEIEDVSDDQGHGTYTAGDAGAHFFDEGLDINFNGAGDINDVTLRTNRTYDIKFRTVDDFPITIDILKGPPKYVGDSTSVDPLQVIRYIDIILPVGVQAWLRFTPQGVEDLRLDVDGDGTFETVVPPSVSATGAAAQDVTAPRIAFDVSRQGDTATVTITATDTETGVRDIHYSTGGPDLLYTAPLTVNIAQTPIVYAYADDNVGNRSFSYKWIEYTPPTTTAAIEPPPNAAGWNNTGVVVTLNALDNIGGSGVGKITYSATGAQVIPETTVDFPAQPPFSTPLPSTAADVASAPFEVLAEGITTITFYATDRAGNTEAPQTIVVKIDQTPPTSSGNATVTGNQATVTLDSSDDQSGVAAIHYAVDGGATQLYTTAFPVSGSGTHTVDFYSLDVAGNVEVAKNITFTLSAPATRADFDGDRQTDISVWNPDNGNWHIFNSHDNSFRTQADWGRQSLGDIPVPGDYDGDGKTDIAIFRPSEGNWYLIYSSTGASMTQNWGGSGDRPCPADFDGDGQTDVAVFRPSEGNWYIKKSTGGSSVQGWGDPSDRLVPGDYDGDGRADIAVWRGSEGNWYILKSSGGARQENWGLFGDRPVGGDYDGDGRADLAVFRPAEGNWYIKKSSGGNIIRNWGDSTDWPIPADYDGDGKTDIAVWRPAEGNWYVIQSSTNTAYFRTLGAGNEVPIPSTYISY